MYYITDCDGVSVDIRVLNWNQKNLQINDRLQSHFNTSAVCFPMRLQLLERFVGIMKNITWKYKCFPAISPPLKNMQVCSERAWLFSTKACKLGIAVLLSSTIVQMYLYIYQNRKTTGQGNRFREEHNKLALNVCGDGLECLNLHQED